MFRSLSVKKPNPESLKHVKVILDEIAATPGRLDKVAILKRNEDNAIFKRVLWATYSEHLIFHIKQFPAYDKVVKTSAGLIGANDTIFGLLKQFTSQSGVSKLEKERLLKVAAIDPETYSVVSMICKRDLCCGISAKTINQAFPDHIKITPYQRCTTSKDIDNIVFDPYAIAQCKANGTFAYLFLDSMKFISRSGSVFKQMGYLRNKMLFRPKTLEFGTAFGLFARGHSKNNVLIGELRVFNTDGTIMDRKEGNGIISSCIHGTADKEVVKRIFYTIWNCVTLEEYQAMRSDVAYQTRAFHAYQYVSAVNDDKVLRFIYQEEVHSKEECSVFYRKMRKQKEEGAVIKNLKGVWKDNTSKDDIKMKAVVECDLKIVGWTKHLKNPKMMGALLLESRDGLLRCKCGSGFTLEERLLDWDEEEGTIVTVEGESVIQNKTDKTKYALYTPTFIEKRHDKKVANSLKEVLDIEASSERDSRKKG